MLDLGRFAVNETHRVKVAAPRCVLRVELTDPRTGDAVAVPGAQVRLVGANGAAVSSTAMTNPGGGASVLVVDRGPGAAVRVDLPGLFDFGAGTLADAASVQAVETRALLRLPEVWRSDRQSALLDDLGGRAKGGRLPALVPGGQGTEDAPWVLRLDHGWTSLAVGFSFHDTQTHARGFVGQGVMVDVFSGPTRVGGGTLAGEDGHHRLRLFDAATAEGLSLRFVTPVGSYLDLTEPPEAPRVRTLPAGTVTPLGKRLERYALPEQWRSRGQLVSVDGGATARPFEEIAGSLLAGGKTVEFDLDDVLLIDDQRRPIKIKEGIGVSVFGGDFVVKKPRKDEPQHSAIVIDRALLRGRDVYSVGVSAARPFASTRVIRRGRRFYELDGTRTVSGEVVGVRAAVRDAHPVIREPQAALEGLERHRAEFHVFDDVGQVDIEGKIHKVRVVLVHVSVRLRPRGLDDEQSGGVLAAAREMFSFAAERWTGEELDKHLAGSHSDKLRPYLVHGEPLELTKFVFHFPTVVQGRTLSVAFLVDRSSDFRAHASRGSVTLNVNTDLAEEAEAVAETGLRLKGNTVAHEMGHVMGLPDEYLEPRSFEQPDRVLTHTPEKDSIMNGNCVPMLRHYYALGSAVAPSIFPSSFSAYCDTRTPSSERGRSHRYVAPVGGPYSTLAEFEIGPKDARFEVHVGAVGDDLDVLGCGPVDGIVVLSPKVFFELVGATANKAETPGAVRTRLFDRLQGWGANGHVAPKVIVRRRGQAGLLERLFLTVQARVSDRRRLQADVRVEVLLPSEQAGRAAYARDGKRVAMHEDHQGALLRDLLGLPLRQEAGLDCIGPGGAGVTFSTSGRAVKLDGGDVAGPGRYVVHTKGPSGGFVPLPPELVAENLSKAINDPENGLSDLVRAKARGRLAVLEKVPDDLVLKSNSSHIVVVPPFRQLVDVGDLAGLVDTIGAKLGGEYEVET